MSIKVFHIIFVVISSMLMIFIGGWAVYNWDYYADNIYLSYLFFSLLSLIILCIYGKIFITKTNDL